MTDEDFYRLQVRALEHENRALRADRLDQYACAALTGLLAGQAEFEADVVFSIAEAMLAERDNHAR